MNRPINQHQTDFDKKLILQVQQYNNIYDKYHHLFKDKEARLRTWNSIAAALNSTVMVCQNRWYNLRCRYTGVKRKMMQDKNYTVNPYPNFNMMHFLDSFIIRRQKPINKRMMMVQRAQQRSRMDPVHFKQFDLQSQTEATIKNEVDFIKMPPLRIRDDLLMSEVSSTNKSNNESKKKQADNYVENQEEQEFDSPELVEVNSNEKIGKIIESAMETFATYFKRKLTDHEAGEVKFGRFLSEGVSKIRNSKRRKRVKLQLTKLVLECKSDTSDSE